jgi:hypothetical protein
LKNVINEAIAAVGCGAADAYPVRVEHHESIDLPFRRVACHASDEESEKKVARCGSSKLMAVCTGPSRTASSLARRRFGGAPFQTVSARVDPNSRSTGPSTDLSRP